MCFMFRRASYGGAARAYPVAGSQRRAGRAGLPGAYRCAACCCATKDAKHRGVEMKSTLAIATIAIICAAGHPIATTVNTPLAQRAPSVAFTLVAGENTADAWNGRWQGTTVSG